MRLQIAIVGALTLIVGFAAAFTTGLFWLGGALTLIGAAYCVWRSWALSGWWRTLIILALFVVAMVSSHWVGKGLERVLPDSAAAWTAAVVSALVAGVLCWVISLPQSKAA